MMDFLNPILFAPFNLTPQMQVAVACSFIFSQLVYLFTDSYWSKRSCYKVLPDIEKIEWQTRIMSTIHALIIFPVVAYVLLTDAEYNRDPIHGRNTLSDFGMCLSAGYFMADLSLVVRYRIPPVTPIVCHHVFAGWGFLLAISNLGAVRWFGTYLLLTEATSPFNNLHWHLVKSNMGHLHLTRVIGYMFTATWIIFRLAVNPLLLYRIYFFWDGLMSIPGSISISLMINIVFLILLNTIYFITGPFYELVFGSPLVSKNIKVARSSKSRKSNSY